MAEAQQGGEVDRSLHAMQVAALLFSVYTAAIIGWLGGAIPVRENQLAMLRNQLELLHRGLKPR